MPWASGSVQRLHTQPRSLSRCGGGAHSANGLVFLSPWGGASHLNRGIGSQHGMYVCKHPPDFNQIGQLALLPSQNLGQLGTSRMDALLAACASLRHVHACSCAGKQRMQEGAPPAAHADCILCRLLSPKPQAWDEQKPSILLYSEQRSQL